MRGVRAEELYSHLGGGATGGEREATTVTEAEQSDPLFGEFQRFDVNDQGHLSHYEVGEMMRDMGYKVDTNYVRSVMEMFSSGARKQPLLIWQPKTFGSHSALMVSGSGIRC